MAGWNMYAGELVATKITDKEYERLFSNFFSTTAKKTTTYKYAYVKAIIDSVDEIEINGDAVMLPLETVFEKFTEYYWQLVLKYGIKQKRGGGDSSIEKILKDELLVEKESLPETFDDLEKAKKNKVIQKVSRECNRYVTGALYEEFEGKLFAFNLHKSPLLWFDKNAILFMRHNKKKLLNSNMRAWASFLEDIETDSMKRKMANEMGFGYIDSRISIFWLLLSHIFNKNP